MKRFFRMLAAAVTAVMPFVNCPASSAADGHKVSIFCDHIVTISQQEGISFAEAAAKVRAMGYNGVDVEITIEQDMLDVLDGLGFEHACAIAHINYAKGPQPEVEANVLSLMKSRGYDRLLIVTDLLKDGASAEDVVARVAAFSRRLAAEGLTAMVEDFDNPASPCYNMAGLDRMFAAHDGLGHVFDSGNYLYAGEDCMVALGRYMDRIAHVHLKDRVSGKDLTCPPVGTGCIPMTFIIKSLEAAGYDGWLTVEQYGSRKMLADSETSYANVVAAMDVQRFRPEMTEYYWPEVPVVEPAPFKGTKAPKGAVKLFDGKNLNAWCSADGSAAQWTVNKDKTFTVDKKKGDIRTKAEFGSFDLHLEFSVPAGIEGSGQYRGNSGIYLQNLYEVQILDSWENPTYVDGMNGSLYKQSVPLANPIRKPGEWNEYDISFTAPVLENGVVVKPAHVSVWLNGILVQDDYELKGTTEYIGLPRPVSTDKGPVLLQSHGDPSAPLNFRNIWIKEK